MFLYKFPVFKLSILRLDKRFMRYNFEIEINVKVSRLIIRLIRQFLAFIQKINNNALIAYRTYHFGIYNVLGFSKVFPRCRLYVYTTYSQRQ